MKIPSFLAAAGEMGELTSRFNWGATPVGSIDTWPQSLRTTLGTMLRSKFPMFLWWGQELICFYNDAYRPSLGNNGKHPAILGMPAKEAWPEIWTIIQPLIDRVMTEQEGIWSENQLVPIYRNGHIEDVYWTFSYSPVIIENDSVGGVLVVCTETTAAVHTYGQLEEAYTQYAFAIDAAELATWDLNPRTNRLTGNARLKEWFGLGPGDDFDLQQAVNIIHEKDRLRVTDAIQTALTPAQGGRYDTEYIIMHPVTKQQRIVRAKGKAMFGEDGQPYRFNGILQDITAETQANNLARKLGVLVQNSVDLMAILQLDGTNSYVNDAGKALLGIDKDADVTKIPITNFHTPEQFAFVASEIIPNVMAKGRWAGQFGIKQGGTGEIIPLYNNCHRIDDERTGEPIGVGTVMRDIRPELNAMHILEEKVQERTKALKEANEELARKNEELASFNFVSSHDLQEPLRKINTFISLIEGEEHNTPTQVLAYFKRIKVAVGRMQALIKDLLAFSETSNAEKVFELADTQRLTEDVVKELADSIAQHNAIVDISPLPALRVIPYQFSQAICNLLTNALKFSREGVPPHITVKGEEIVSDSKPYYRIIVADNGIGFKQEFTGKIFEVFQRLHSRNQYEGTGIGLAICKKVMENHGGFITAESEVGEGARFSLWFPV